jgi:large subunit ribosomal protein L29
MMKASEIRDWDDVEIRARLGELREEKFRLRFRMATMELENPKMVQHIRRDVARLNTILRERELSEMPGTADEKAATIEEKAATIEETAETIDETAETIDETAETAEQQ